MPVEEVNGLLVKIARTLRLKIGPHCGDGCLQHKTTFSAMQNRQP